MGGALKGEGEKGLAARKGGSNDSGGVMGGGSELEIQYRTADIVQMKSNLLTYSAVPPCLLTCLKIYPTHPLKQTTLQRCEYLSSDMKYNVHLCKVHLYNCWRGTIL